MNQAILKQLLCYEPETGLFRWAVTRGSRAKKGTIAGTKTNTGHLSIQLQGVLYLAHRLAYLYITGNWPDSAIRHINTDRLDNRFENLKLLSDGRRPEIKGDIATVQLSCGQVVLIDAEDASRVGKHLWSLSNSYPSARINNTLVLLHVFLIGAAPKGSLIDHKNRNKLDNRKQNLRHTTHSVNVQNSDTFDEYGGTQPVKPHAPGGTSIDRTHNTYKAYYTVWGNRVNVGTYKTREAAEQARHLAYTQYLKGI